MILSELVKLKIELKKYIDLTAFENEAYKVMDNLKALRASVSDATLDQQLTELLGTIQSQTYLAIKMANSKYHLVNEIIYQQMIEQSKQYFVKGYRVFQTDIEDDRNNRKLPLSLELTEILIGRIRLYTDWHYPGMEIGPHDGEFTEHLVACDPLYLVDTKYEYLESTSSKFAPEYQVRLRPYHINDDKRLSELPSNQFGIIFSWNYFNYFQLDDIKTYLSEAFRILRPGGVFMFSYNDGDMYNGARHVEWGGMTYVPKSLLAPMIESLGFEIAASYGFDTDWHNISWVEVRKPGTLETIRAHQTLGIVKDIE